MNRRDLERLVDEQLARSAARDAALNAVRTTKRVTKRETPWARVSKTAPRVSRPTVLEQQGIDCHEIQDWLFDYLKTDIDPYDFHYMIPRWADDALEDTDALGGSINDDTSYDILSEEQQRDFVRWLNERMSAILSHDTGDAPAYLTLHAKRKLPPGTILVHFTHHHFDSFDLGSTLEGLHLSTWKTKKDVADCTKNLSNDIGSFEVVFGFAVEADGMSNRYARAFASKYGRNVVLFRCDCAVLAYHDGDEEDQVIFPICGEYDVVTFASDGGGGFTRGSAWDDDEVSFEDFEAALAWYEERV